MKVDMPWGVAAIRGTFWMNWVGSNQQSTNVVEGQAEVTSGGQTVAVPAGYSTTISSSSAPPTAPTSMTQQQRQQWNNERDWFQETAQSIEDMTPLTIQQGTTTENNNSQGAEQVINDIDHNINVTTGQSSSGGSSGNTTYQVTAPTASPDAGTYSTAQSISLSTTTEGASIYYTVDGSDPTTSSTRSLFSSAISIAETTTIKAYAIKNGMNASTVASFEYIINLPLQQVTAPIASPDAGTYSTVQSISLSSTTEGATIYYTIDGSDPTSSTRLLFSAAISIAETTTVKAYASKDGMTASDTVSFTYTIGNYGRSYPVMAYDSENNRYLMVYYKHDIDARDYNLYGRLLAANGDYIGEEFSIVTSRDVGNHFDFKPDVAYDSAEKKFLVVWNEISSAEDPYWDIYGQIMNPDGSKSGEPFAISDPNDGKRQTKPFVAYDNVNNKFFIAYRYYVDTTQQDDIHGRFVSIAGNSPALLGTDFLIAGGDWCQDLSDVVFNEINEFMLPIGYSDNNRLVAVNASTGTNRVACSFGLTAARPSLVFDNVNKRFLATWTSGSNIYGRFIKQDGSTDGTVFQLSDTMFDGNDGYVSVTLANGTFYVAWQDERYYDYYNTYINIAAKKIDAITGEVSAKINITQGANNAHSPCVCGSNNGALVAWTAESENEPAVIGLVRFNTDATTADPPPAENIYVYNNVSGDDSVMVRRLPDNTIVNVYDAAAGGNLLGYTTVIEGGAWLTIEGGFKNNLSNVYVSITPFAQMESNRTAMTIPVPPSMIESTDYDIDNTNCGYGKLAFKVTAAQKSAMEAATGKSIAAIKAYVTSINETTFVGLADAEATNGVMVSDEAAVFVRDPGLYGYAIAAYDDSNQVVAYYVSETWEIVY